MTHVAPIRSRRVGANADGRFGMLISANKVSPPAHLDEMQTHERDINRGLNGSGKYVDAARLPSKAA
jgi:hypothetical protein